MSATDELVANNEEYAASFDKADLPLPPGKKVAVLACMDARLQVYEVLGLEVGDAHIIRNAGGVVTDDAIRSLAISQRLLGTEEIVLIHHTDCGMLTFTDDKFKAEHREGDRDQAGHGRPRRSRTSTPMSASRSTGSRPRRSSRARTRCADSSTTCRRQAA